MNVIGDVKGKTCILVDDIIDSGGTIVNAAKALNKEVQKRFMFILLTGYWVETQLKKLKIQLLKI